jgi:hypothetical protein
MAIEFSAQKFGFEIRCDSCERLIELDDSSEWRGAGIVIWTKDATEGSAKDFRFVHKHHCDDRDHYPFWIDLDFFLKELAHSVDMRKLIKVLKDECQKNGRQDDSSRSSTQHRN